uniref:AMP-binding domain-containing protein n=1 Tax=Macrostomum lignano TaxID=282301 RepID=A0A1I8FN78_9PLAT
MAALRSLGANKGRTAGRVRGAGQPADSRRSAESSPVPAGRASARMTWPASWSRRRRQQIARTGQAGAMIERRRVGDSLVADLEGGAQQASVRRVDLSLERVSALYNRTVSITAWNRRALWRSGRASDCSGLTYRTKGSPGKSSATPQILADVGNQTAEKIAASVSSRHAVSTTVFCVLTTSADARRNWQPAYPAVFRRPRTVRGQQGEVIGVAKHAEPSLRLASTHASPQQEAVVVGRPRAVRSTQSSTRINRNGGSVSPWSTPEDVSKKSDRPSGVETAAVVPWYSAMTAENQQLWHVVRTEALWLKSRDGSLQRCTQASSRDRMKPVCSLGFCKGGLHAMIIYAPAGRVKCVIVGTAAPARPACCPPTPPASSAASYVPPVFDNFRLHGDRDGAAGAAEPLADSAGQEDYESPAAAELPGDRRVPHQLHVGHRPYLLPTFSPSGAR